ncbi:MAG: hypothetical protein JJE04_16470 [Acidobacteriia bacterium]|nr:hypothetical protein [Terriglobia bacterium]
MDLRLYYRKIREIEQSIPEQYAVVVSMDTPDGGKSGIRTEVLRLTAARMVVEGKASLASEKDAAAFYEGIREARRIAEEEAARERVHVTLVSESDLRSWKGSGKNPKG